MVHYCVVPGCHNSSVSHPHLSFHCLPLNDKRLLKIWVHKIRRKNLPLNANSRVCYEHFETSRLLRHSNYPTKKLPTLPLETIPNKSRKPPKERTVPQILQNDDSDESVEATVQVDVGYNTEMMGTDIDDLKHQVSEMAREVATLKKEVMFAKFRLSNIGSNDKKVAFYTGFPSFGYLEAYFDFLGPSVDELTYWSSYKANDVKGKGRPRGLPPIKEFFMVLVRLRLGSLEQDLADRLEVSCSSVSRICTTWINFLYLKLKEIPLWPPREVIQGNMPKSFSEMYPSTHVIIDATEIYVEKPSLPDVQRRSLFTRTVIHIKL